MRLLKLVPDNTNLHFLRWRNVAIAISFAMIVASWVLVATRGLNYGVDFAGGQMIRVSFQQPPALDQLRSRVNGLGLGESSIQEFGSPRDISIRMPLPDGGEEAANAAAARVRGAIETTYRGAKVQAVETVSGKVSGELVRAGAMAILFAMIAISIYIWMRFEWQFGVGALFALLHDVSLTMGFFSLTQLEFNLNVVAAILTIVGYSLNDTIVVYDRIRENFRKYRKMDIVALLDLSVNETLARTVMTSLTMMIALVILLLIGPEVIFGFTAAMLLGIFIGTYSSIYMAAPWLIWLKVTSNSFIPKTAGPAGAERVKSVNEGRLMTARLEPGAPPSGPVVQGFRGDGFVVDGRSYRGVWLTPAAAGAWEPPAPQDLAEADLADPLAIDPAPEFLLLGTGGSLRRPPPALIAALEARGIGVEAMDSRAAARAWAVLRAEGRWIAAALMPL